MIPILGIDVPGKYIGGYAVYDPSNRQLLEVGDIIFKDAQSERGQYRQLSQMLERLHRQYRFNLIAIERPFLYLIAQWVGAIKCWASRKRNLRWYVLGSSNARKVGCGNGKLGKDSVRLTIEAAWRKCGFQGITQHQADAALYAFAVHRLLDPRVPHLHPVISQSDLRVSKRRRNSRCRQLS